MCSQAADWKKRLCALMLVQSCACRNGNISGVCQWLPQGVRQWLPQGVHQWLPQGVCQWLPQGVCQWLPQYVCQWLPQGVCHCQWLPQGVCQWLPQDVCQWLPQDVCQWLPQVWVQEWKRFRCVSVVTSGLRAGAGICSAVAGRPGHHGDLPLVPAAHETSADRPPPLVSDVSGLCPLK